nr:SDR family NAD(P)-dependent oxidoreductase [Candidatus Freyarchaeota archaeon]
MRFEGKVAMVTGADQGIGRSIALRFAKEGADIAVVEYAPETAEKVAEEIRALGRKASRLLQM